MLLSMTPALQIVNTTTAIKLVFRVQLKSPYKLDSPVKFVTNFDIMDGRRAERNSLKTQEHHSKSPLNEKTPEKHNCWSRQAKQGAVESRDGR